MEVTGYSESAQRIFAEALAVGSSPLNISGLTAAGIPFLSVAATTVVVLENTHDDFELTLVLDDRATINLITSVDTEDFRIVAYDIRGHGMSEAPPEVDHYNT